MPPPVPAAAARPTLFEGLNDFAAFSTLSRANSRDSFEIYDVSQVCSASAHNVISDVCFVWQRVFVRYS